MIKLPIGGINRDQTIGRRRLAVGHIAAGEIFGGLLADEIITRRQVNSSMSYLVDQKIRRPAISSTDPPPPQKKSSSVKLVDREGGGGG